MKGPTMATVFGTRPEIIKLSSFIDEADRRVKRHFMIHTNQHYDYEMDKVFFEDLDLRQPDFRLIARPGDQVVQLGEMISQLGTIFNEIEPDTVVVLGDTNSTVAGAVAAKKHGSRLAHIEAGCRSFDMAMPEEHNRIMIDHVSDILFAPTRASVQNLGDEGIAGKRVRLVGSTLIEVCRRNLKIAKKKSTFKARKPYALMTIHRRGNIENEERLASIVRAMARVSKEIPVIFPAHPHTRSFLTKYGLDKETGKVRVIQPLGYLDFLKALSETEFVLTDSGGIQQEAQVFSVPILTARKETEWVETVESGGAILVDADEKTIVKYAEKILKDKNFKKKLRGSKNPYSETNVNKKIVSMLIQDAKSG